jgi:hypothetical protein
MALVIADRVRETTQVTGTGSATLLGAVTGYQSFSVIGNGNTTYYCLSDQGGPNWEVGIGTWSTGGTLARTTVLSSSNGGALVNFTTGTKDVFVTQPSEEAVYGSGTSIVAPSGALLGVGNGGTGLNSLTAGYIPYGNGTGALSSSSNLYFSGTNLGIGTSSPTQSLEISNTGNYQMRLGNGSGVGVYDIGRNISSGYLAFYGSQTGRPNANCIFFWKWC